MAEDVEVGVVRIQITKDKDDSKDITKSLDDLTDKAKTTEDAFKRMAGNIGKAIASLGVIKGLSNLTKTGVKALDSLANSTRQMRILYGDGADDIVDYAKTVEKYMGIPAEKFLATQGTLATMMTGFGLATSKTQDMSKNLTQLTYDLEAFNGMGMKQDQIMTAIQSALSGYDRSLRKLGYTVNEVTLQDVAYRNGLDVNVRELDRASKAQLAYIAIMEQSANMGVFGAMASEVTSPIVAFNILKGQVLQVAKTLAGVLIPVIMQVMVFLQALAMAITSVIKKLASFFGLKIVELDFGVTPKSIGGLTDASDGMGDIGKQAKGANKRVKELRHQLAGFDKLNVMKQETEPTPTSGGGASVPEIPAMGGLDIDMPDYGDFLGDLTKKARELAPALEKIITVLGALALAMGAFKIIMTIVGWVQTLTTFLAPLFSAISGGFGVWRVWTSEMGLVKGTLDLLTTALGAVSLPILAVIALVVAVGGALVQLWNTNEEFRNNVIEAWNGIKEVFVTLWNSFLKPIGDGIIKMFKDIWNFGIKPVWDAFVEFVRVVSTAVMDLWNKYLQPVVKFIIEMWGPPIARIVNFVMETFSFAFSAVGNVLKLFINNATTIVTMVINVFKGLIDFVKAVFTGDWRGAWEAVIGIFKSLWDGLKGIVSNVWDSIIGLFANGGRIFTGIAGAIANVFIKVVNSIIRGMNNVIAVPFKALDAIFGKIRDISILGAKPFGWIGSINAPQLPEVPAYEQGTNYVPKTGLALLHEGEEVTPKKVAQGKKYKSQMGSSEETDAKLDKMITLLTAIVRKDTDVTVTATDVTSGTDKYNRILAKSGGVR